MEDFRRGQVVSVLVQERGTIIFVAVALIFSVVANTIKKKKGIPNKIQTFGKQTAVNKDAILRQLEFLERKETMKQQKFFRRLNNIVKQYFFQNGMVKLDKQTLHEMKDFLISTKQIPTNFASFIFNKMEKMVNDKPEEEEIRKINKELFDLAKQIFLLSQKDSEINIAERLGMVEKVRSLILRSE